MKSPYSYLPRRPNAGIDLRAAKDAQLGSFVLIKDEMAPSAAEQRAAGVGALRRWPEVRVWGCHRFCGA
jgi:hypothetical protein